MSLLPVGRFVGNNRCIHGSSYSVPPKTLWLLPSNCILHCQCHHRYTGRDRANFLLFVNLVLHVCVADGCRQVLYLLDYADRSYSVLHAAFPGCRCVMQEVWTCIHDLGILVDNLLRLRGYVPSELRLRMVLTAAGYLIPFEKMHVWFRWIFYLNPGSYAFEALMANEFTGLKLDCIEPDYIPYGTGYPDSSSAYRGCSVLGSDENGLIDGAAYIREQYHYSHGHIWRSFGVIIGMWAFFIFLTSVGFEKLNSQGGSSVLLYKRGSQKKRTPDMEKGQQNMSQPAANTGALANTAKQSTFTWNNLDYHVPFHGEKKQLLNQVFGYVKPGNLVALMGCSGAGKTTYVFWFINF